MPIPPRLAHLLRGARRALAGAPLATLVAFLALLPPAPARAADTSSRGSCPPPAKTLTADLFREGLANARDHGFLWRISKDGHSSYLYGTIHAAKLEWMFPGPTLLDAIGSSDTIALELDVLNHDIQTRLAAAIGPHRAEPLPPELVQRIERQMSAECVDATAWSKFAPEFQIASLSVMAARRDGFDPAYAVDLVLAYLGRNLNKSVVSLETPEAQMQALQMPTQAETIDFVSSGLDELESGRARPLLNHLARVWTDSDYDELNRYAQWCECLRTASDRAAMKRLLDDRNPLLATAIDSMHASGRQVFAAVGSLHMIGPTGLPALLRQRGYKVEQADFPR
jgi:uncharacterized protein YbaP (TraB family)